MLEKFADIELFKGVSIDYLANLETLCSEIKLAKGDFLFHQGDSGDGMYIIIEGEIDIIVGDDKNQIISTLTAGQPFGEIALLDKQTRIASAVAKAQATLLFLHLTEFAKHIKMSDPNSLRISHNIALNMAGQLERANQLLMTLQNKAESKTMQREVTKYKEQLLEEGLF